MWTHRKAVFCVAIAVFMSGCANGRTQIVTVDSFPPGATVRIQPDGGTLTTPAQAVLPRKLDHVVIVERQGYETKSVAISSKPSGKLWGQRGVDTSRRMGRRCPYGLGDGCRIRP